MRSHLNPVPVHRQEGRDGTHDKAMVASVFANCRKGLCAVTRVLCRASSTVEATPPAVPADDTRAFPPRCSTSQISVQKSVRTFSSPTATCVVRPQPQHPA